LNPQWPFRHFRSPSLQSTSLNTTTDREIAQIGRMSEVDFTRTGQKTQVSFVSLWVENTHSPEGRRNMGNTSIDGETSKT
jgi:hypothetical protein